MKNIDFKRLTIIIIMFSGIVLSTVQYIYNRSLWLDEARLALNIINKNRLELLEPLQYKQVAPILFLQVEKVFSILFPNSEYGLRLLPLFSFWFSLYLFYRLINLLFCNSYTIIFSLSLFVFNAELIYYSSEVKQYMSDVFVLLLIYFIILKSYKREENKYYVLGIFGSIGIFLSNVAPIILLSSGLYLLYEYLINKRKYFKYLAFTFFLWMITFLLYYIYFVHGHPTRDSMVNYWSNADAFMPYNPFTISFYTFILNKGIMLFTALLPFSIIGAISLPILFLVSSFTLIIRKNIGIILLTLSPLIFHLLLSAIKLYPFDLRFILYCSSALIIFISFGFDKIINVLCNDLKIERVRLIAILIPFSFLLIFFRKGFPFKRDEIKASINYIQQHIRQNDKIYVYYRALPAFLYYNDIQFIKTKAPKIHGGRYRKDKNGYINELRNLKGRNWLLFSHAQGKEEENYIIGQLDTLGYNKIETFTTVGSSTYLYDFRD